jgi:hypothetical protein
VVQAVAVMAVQTDTGGSWHGSKVNTGGGGGGAVTNGAGVQVVQVVQV